MTGPQSCRMVGACLAVLLLMLTMPGMSGTAQENVAITIGTTDFPRTVDPADAIDYPSWELMTHLYTGLTRQVPGTLSYELALASGYTISSDGLIHTFTIRPDAAFDDGTPITAGTFATSINRVIGLGRGSADFISRFIADVRVSGDDGNALQFVLRIPLPDFEALVALPPFFPQHPLAFPADDLLDLQHADAFIGNGVYRLESVLPGQEIVLAANPAFQGPPALNARVILRRYQLPIDLRRALQTGEVDIAWRGLALPDLDALARLPEIVIQRQPNLHVFYLLFNQNQLSINNQLSFDDPALRQAFALLIDRERAAAHGFDHTVTPLYSLLPPQFGQDPVLFPTRDAAMADAVLREAGYRPRRRTVQTPLYISSENYGDLMIDAAQELRRSLEENEIVNISAIIDDRTATFTRTVLRGEYLNAVIGWRPLFASPAGYLIPLAHSTWPVPAGGGYASDAIDALLRQAALVTDSEERMTIDRAVERLLRDDYALLPLWQGQDVIAYREGVSGVMVEANSWLRYDTLVRR